VEQRRAFGAESLEAIERPIVLTEADVDEGRACALLLSLPFLKLKPATSDSDLSYMATWRQP
jgi:hypothetical protein